MGTNFYLVSKTPKVVITYPGVHIAKTSFGWRPLFDSSESGMRSVAELKAAYDSGEYEIRDEYEDRYSWEEFEQRVLKHCPDGLSHRDPFGSECFVDGEGYEFLERGFS